MSRSQYIGLERSETTMHGRVRDSAERRAALEEQLLTAYAAGDMRRVSELRAVLADLADEPSEADA